MQHVSHRRLLTRVILAYLGFQSLQLGAWALVAPRSFYDDFPGLGRSWVSVDGPYNEHLIRDVGALNLALLVLVVAAGITLSRHLVITAALATLAWGVPHLLYHLFNTEGYSGSDLAASLIGLAVVALLPLLIIFNAVKSVEPASPAKVEV